jgi:hypothetical protein
LFLEETKERERTEKLRKEEFKAIPRVRRAEADAEIILCNLVANLARKSDPRAHASTGRPSQAWTLASSASKRPFKHFQQ